MPIHNAPALVRVGTTAEWADTDSSDGAAAPVLAAGEIGVDTTKNEFFVGDGTTAATALPRMKQVRMVTLAPLVAGVKVISDTAITANSVVQLALKTLGGVSLPVGVGVTARTPGTSYTVTSGSASDTSVYVAIITEP